MNPNPDPNHGKDQLVAQSTLETADEHPITPIEQCLCPTEWRIQCTDVEGDLCVLCGVSKLCLLFFVISTQPSTGVSVLTILRVIDLIWMMGLLTRVIWTFIRWYSRNFGGLGLVCVLLHSQSLRIISCLLVGGLKLRD